ncbi:MAG: tRNA pseudouridine(38-40) synthase TruA [Oscillospiraceae bacterium]|nr:tRNA pseudouridine(38-40) synthase TruA [Oscillospiraceae bacterium]
MKNIAVRLMYDGTKYHGWQVQKSVSTISGTIEEALSRLYGEEIRIIGCGRTDAGVHGKQYCFSYKAKPSIPIERLPYAVNALLPSDIALQRAIYVPDDFNANLSCLKKEYTYLIYNSRIRDPFYVTRALFYPLSIDIDAMDKAALSFVGTHDFSAMRSVGTVTKTTIRTVYWCEIDVSEPFIEIRICADGFLYNMARAIVGTLLYVSEKKIAPEAISSLLEARDRRAAGPTVPPHGLYLTKLWYEGEAGKMFT